MPARPGNRACVYTAETAYTAEGPKGASNSSGIHRGGTEGSELKRQADPRTDGEHGGRWSE